MANTLKRYTNFILNHPFLVILMSLLMIGLVGSGGKHLEFNTNYRVFFSDANPQMEAFDQIEKVYIKTDNVLFTIKAKEGDVFQPRILQLVQDLTADGWKLPYSQRVDSITNFQHSYAEGDDLTVLDLVEGDPSQKTQQELDELKQIALKEPILSGKLINKQATATGVNVLINLPRKKMTEVPEVAAAARELVAKYQELYPEIEIHPSGMVFMNNAFMENSMQDMSKLMPMMFVMLLVVMVVLVRSVSATFATLIIIMFSAMAAMGFGGWMGFPLTPPSALTPTIVLTLAIADSIHIVVSVIKGMHAGLSKRDALVDSMRINFQPIFLTSVTTIIGFLSLNFSDSPPFWHLGNMTAFGIGAAFVFSVFLLPALLMLLPLNFKPRKENEYGLMERFADFVVKFNRALLVVSVLLTALIGSMISKIEINDQFVQYFDYSISFRPDTEFMMENLSGIYTFEYSVPSKGPEQITQPEYLQNLSEFTDWLRTQPEVDHVFSMSDVFKRLNKNMHADDETMYRIPDRQDMAAQYLLLYEFSLPYGLDLNDRVNIDKSATRVTVTIKDLSTKEGRAFKARTEKWLDDNAPSYMKSEATSPAVMFSFISERNINSMVRGNILSLVLISGIILVALRSFSMGILSLVPNLMPLVLGFGFWGMLIGQINMAVAFAFAVCLGIIVDDTIHFLSKYIRARREKHLDARQAIRYAFHTVGSALFMTTVILVGGFIVLAQSGFQMNSYLGLLVGIVISSALFLDFLLLPPLLILIEDIRNYFKKGVQNEALQNT